MLAASTTADQRCRVLIAVPNLLRDLEGHALIAYHLQTRYGYHVELCTLSRLGERTLGYAPDVLVLDRIDTRVPLVRRARQLGMKVVLLPTVGFHQEGLATEARRAGGLVRGEELLDRCFTWGSHGRDILRRHTRLTDEQVCVVGAPRFDAYSEPFLSLCEGRDSLLRRIGVGASDAPLVVWSTNTCHRRTDDLAASIAGAVATGVPEQEIRGQLEDEGTSFREMSSAVGILAERHPEWNFLIKLHPSELPGPYRTLAEGTPNIHLCGNERIRDVLNHCDVLLTHCSTTATEAWMLGKPVIEVMIGRYLVPPPREYLEGNHTVTELGEMERLLSRSLREPHAAVPDEQQRARDAFLASVYHRIDGKASERCAREIHELLSLPDNTAAHRAKIRSSAARARSEWQRASERRVSRRVKRMLGVPADASLRFWKRKFWKRRQGVSEAPFALKAEITSEMLRELYARYDMVLQLRKRPGAHPRSVGTT